MSFEVAGQTIRCPVATAEDILLAKLQWYRAGLDQACLSVWAQRLGVQDLLARAFDARI